MGTLVFVYGTLKRGYSNHRCLGDAQFVGNAATAGNGYILYDMGVPFLYEADHGSPLTGQVIGEVYDVNDQQLLRCDCLEGHPRAYCREERQFSLAKDDGSFVLITAWVYLWRHERDEDRAVKPIDGMLVWDLDGHRKLRAA